MVFRSFHKLETLFTNTNSYENIPLAIIIRKTCVNIGKGDEDKVIDLLYLNLLQKSKKVSEFKIFFELQNDLQGTYLLKIPLMNPKILLVRRDCKK